MLGVDLETEAQVVVATVSAAAVTPAVQARLEREVVALDACRSAQLAPLIHVGEADGMLFAVRPYVAGETLADRLRGGPLPVADAIALTRDLMLGLQAMHDCGLLHRELEPASVVVREGVEGGGVLTYTGLSRASRLSSAGDLPLEAAYYTSPEEAGLLQRVVDERSDLYSAGAVLFESLCGRPPFDGATVNEVLRQHVAAAEPRLCDSRPEVPQAVEELTRRLLRTEAPDRYPSATAVAFDLTRILSAIKRGVVPEIGADPRRLRNAELAEPAFIGRESELQALGVKLEDARRGDGSLILLEGESGAGKSRLLEELAHRNRDQGVWILRGGGRDRAAQNPYQVLEGVVATIVARLQTDESFRELLRSRLQGHEPAIIAAMPTLSAALGHGSSSELATEAFGQIRSMRALTLLLASVGTTERPALVLLDDCQWADELTLQLLQQWPEQPELTAGGVNVLMIAAFRSEEVAADHRLRDVPGAGEIALPMLNLGEVERLVGSMAPHVPAEARELVQHVSGGSPFMAAEVLRGLVETGVLTPEVGGWRVEPERMADAQSSRRAARFVSRRFDQLPTAVLDLLSVGAVLGKQFALEAARQLASQSLADGKAALAEAHRRHIVWFDREAGQWAFVHDKLRETLLARLSEEHQRELHLSAALSLEDTDPARVFDLAYHFDAAGNPGRALPYALEAAARARARFAPEIAERYYCIAKRGADPADATTQRLVSEGLGDVAMLQGGYAEAGDHLVAAASACEDELSRARIEGKLGELAFKRGDVETAVRTLESALRLLGERVPRRPIGVVRALLVQLLVQLLHTLLPTVFLGRRRLEGAERELLAGRLLSDLAHAHWFRSGRIPCFWAHLRGLNLMERYPPTAELAQTYSDHAPAMTMIPYFKRGIAYGRKSLAIRQALGDTWGEAQSQHFLGVVLYSASRFEEALESCRAAVETLERTGDQWEVSTAKWHIAFSLYRLGRLEEAIAVSRQVHRAAIRLGDAQASGISLGAWAKAARGDIPPEPIRDALQTVSSDVHTSAEVLQADAVRLLAHGDPGAAVAALDRADLLVRGAGLRQEYVAPVLPWLATALRMQLAATTQLAPQERRRLAKRARRVARRARRLSSRYRNNLPHALREQGLLAAAAGRPRKAGKLLDESLHVAERQGATHEYALTLLARGQVGAAQGWPEGSAELTRARWLLDPGTAGPATHGDHEPTLSLADRFTTLVDAGRSIASGLTRDAVFAAVHEAAIGLLRGQRCTVFSVAEGDEGPVLAPVAGAPEDDDSRAAVASALRIGHPVVTELDLHKAGEPKTGESRLCAIVLVRGRPEACVHVNHSVVGGLFGQEEERLAAYIATLAGAALENAQGFAEAEALSRSLERRVQERTAELSASKEGMEATLSLLSATLESTTDGILVVDGAGMIVSHNRKFSDMWHMPAEILESGDDERAIERAAEQLVEPEQFVTKVRELYAEPDAESYDLLEFKDGRVVERYSQPQRIGGKSVGRVWSFRDVTLQKRSERELEHLANHDGLTGLMNRRSFEHEVQRTVAHVSRYGGRAAAMILDVDNFKYVNDTLGHAAGDQLIRSVAQLLSQRLRGSDVVARLGGDEFAMLLIGVDGAAAQQVAVDVLTAVRHHSVVVAGQRVSMTASIGVALLEPGTADAGQLIADADLAMYEAKRGGRDGLSVLGPERVREARAEARLSWAERLREALENDHFELYAQPILDLATGEINRHEVLLRMPDDEGSTIAPGAFLPSAERLGLGPAIDRWVVARAIRELGAWTGEGASHSLEINLSGTSIGDPELPALIAREIAATGVDPGRLIFEVTETATIANMDEAKRFTAALTELGCKFALDDFGTGFGSFYYLKHLPVDYLKIDGDFIGDLEASDVDRLVVNSIVEMAKGMGKKTIAEYVRDADTLELVRRYGIDYAQGYHIGRPLPLRQVARAWSDAPQ